jgi:hypothetical protein
VSERVSTENGSSCGHCLTFVFLQGRASSYLPGFHVSCGHILLSSPCCFQFGLLEVLPSCVLFSGSEFKQMSFCTSWITVCCSLMTLQLPWGPELLPWTSHFHSVNQKTENHRASAEPCVTQACRRPDVPPAWQCPWVY